MEEKYESFKQKILKLNELALRGEEGEAINARKAMVRLCSTLGVNLEDILNESEQKKEYVFNVGCDHLLKELFFMCSEKILGGGEIWYKEKNSHILGTYSFTICRVVYLLRFSQGKLQEGTESYKEKIASGIFVET